MSLEYAALDGNLYYYLWIAGTTFGPLKMSSSSRWWLSITFLFHISVQHQVNDFNCSQFKHRFAGLIIQSSNCSVDHYLAPLVLLSITSLALLMCRASYVPVYFWLRDGFGFMLEEFSPSEDPSGSEGYSLVLTTLGGFPSICAPRHSWARRCISCQGLVLSLLFFII